jgi:hypothetical protein
MQSELTYCPNCRQRAVTEELDCFQCIECGQWGFAPDKIIYGPDAEYRASGQVYRKPRAA